MRLARNEQLAYFGDFPTLAKVRKVYGEGYPESWLVGQLVNLSEYCGVKDKLTNAQLHEVAAIIASEYYYLKVSELMLFFLRFKLGRYGQFYGNIDPLRITTALATFIINERRTAWAEREKEERRRKIEEGQRDAITHEQWQAIKAEQEKTKQHTA